MTLACNVLHAENEAIYQRHLEDGGIVLSNLPDTPDFELLLAAPLADLASSALPENQPGLPKLSLARRIASYRQAVAEIAGQINIDPLLVHAVITVESGYNPQAVSPKGAVGLMQLMPGTARRYGVIDARDPIQNIRAGARYLNDLLRMFGDDLSLALAAYNAGERSVMRYGRRIPPFAETVAYVPKVLALYKKFSAMQLQPDG